MIIRFPLEEYFNFNNRKYNVTRNQKESNTDTAERPDFLFCNTYESLIFKGEEKALNSEFELAKYDLINKKRDFNSSFLLCYAAAGSLLQLFLLNNNYQLEKVFPQDEPIDLCEPLNRCEVVARIINIGRLLIEEAKVYVDEKSIRPVEVNEGGERNSYYPWATIKINKQHPNFKNCKKAWELLNIKKIPGAIDCIKAKETSRQFNVTIRKCDKATEKITTELDLVKAIITVLNALDALHKQQMVHCDICWASVFKCRNKKEFCLSCFDLALQVNSRCSEINEELFDYHYSKFLEEDEVVYTIRHDLCQVGKLIEDYPSNSSFNVSNELKEFAKTLKGGHFETAKQAMNCMGKLII